MEIKKGYPTNLNLIEKVDFGRKEGANRNFRCFWTSSLGDKYDRITGASIWPYKPHLTKRKYFGEDCEGLTGKRLVLVLKGAVRDIPFVATVKTHWGSVINLLHSDGREEQINVRDPKFDDLLTIKCLDVC